MTFAVFGYGSLVNRKTLPAHLAARKATLRGWRRAWRATSLAEEGGVCSMSVVPGDDAIDGLVITFDDAVRPIIDAREYRYDALAAKGLGEPVIIFRAAPDIDRFGDRDYPVHLSYLDVIVQGFLAEFGRDGIDRFFATTDGWHVPIVDDRATPRYPRAQHLSVDEKKLTDHMLQKVDATVLSIDEAPPQT